MVFNWFKRKFSTDELPETLEPKTSQPEAEFGDVNSGDFDSDDADSDDAGSGDFGAEDIDSGDVDSGDVDSGDVESDDNESAEDYLAWAQAAFANLQGSDSEDSDNDVDEGNGLDRDEPVFGAADLSPKPQALEAVTPEVSIPEAVIEVESATEPVAIAANAATVQSRSQAIVPEPEEQASLPPISEVPSPKSSSEPKVETDAGFLWSTEVLAAQGRPPEEVSPDEINWLQKLRSGLTKTRRGFVNQLKSAVGKGPLNQEAVEEIETLLLQADVGVQATDLIVAGLQQKIREDALPSDQAIAYLKELLQNMLDSPFKNGYSASFAPEKSHLNIWLMAGVNGVGKTTTIGKLTQIATTSGYSCLIAAADTFRAAAVEQVKVWGARSQVDVICNPGQNTDPASVVFDAISAAQSRGIDLLLVDTAGRLQNKKNLMDELAKVRRIIQKKAPEAKVESLLVLDATLGQNGLRQAQVFAEAAQLTGVVLTKLDGTAKGGVALGVVQQLGLPIRFIGAGEGITDLRPFSSYEFVEALLSE